jgi:hypothetical protein
MPPSTAPNCSSSTLPTRLTLPVHVSPRQRVLSAHSRGLLCVCCRHACRRWASRVAAGAGAAADTLLSRLRLLPTIIGLSLIPLMPLFDAPIEHLMERLFAMAWRLPRTSEWHERVLGHRSSATLTDYEVATCRLDATTDTPFVPRQPPPHPPPLPPPTRREQPELQRASGHGDPAYEHEPPAAPPPTHAPAS